MASGSGAREEALGRSARCPPLARVWQAWRRRARQDVAKLRLVYLLIVLRGRCPPLARVWQAWPRAGESIPAGGGAREARRARATRGSKGSEDGAAPSGRGAQRGPGSRLPGIAARADTARGAYRSAPWQDPAPAAPLAGSYGPCGNGTCPQRHDRLAKRTAAVTGLGPAAGAAPRHWQAAPPRAAASELVCEAFLACDTLRYC